MLGMLMEACIKNNCILALLWSLWDNVWDILFGASPIFVTCISRPEMSLQLLCGAVRLCVHPFIFTQYLLWTFCVPVAHFLLCLKGNS